MTYKDHQYKDHQKDNYASEILRPPGTQELTIGDDLLLTQIFAWEVGANGEYNMVQHVLWNVEDGGRRITPATTDLKIGIDMRIKKTSLNKIYHATSQVCQEEKNDTCYVKLREDILLSNFVEEGDDYISFSYPIGQKGHRMKILIERIV